MTHEETQLSMFLGMPVADGLDAVDELLAIYRTSWGDPRKSMRRVLVALRLMFVKLGPECCSRDRWEKLDREIRGTLLL
jgi:hypothetical protein